MPEGGPDQSYDRRAAAYDRVVGSPLYNRLMWGSSPAAYAAFAARAVSSGRGPMLDAGCGSLVFTAGIYAGADRPLVLLDKSLGMLEAARDRLRAVRGVLPASTVFLQADLLDLPLASGCFSTVLSMGMLHLFDDVVGLVAALDRPLAPGGHLYLTSLVAERRIGRAYLSLLHRAGEVATPRTYAQTIQAVQRGVGSTGRLDGDIQGSMAFMTLDR
ncbi:MAG TPA: class I SAM-dependent methyltransferase [Vicinamibacterales bacterium]|nr:class I SAM-dependent methyltransferase [Vicinamibacterales bacterium]